MTSPIANKDEMWNNACFMTRLVASCVRVSERAGCLIKEIMEGGDLKIVNKGLNGLIDYQTEADRSAQYCIIHSLTNQFGNHLKIVGEEETTSIVHELESGYCSGVLEIDKLCSQKLHGYSACDVIVWVDPLDGTSEFARAVEDGSRTLLNSVTVLIGIANIDGEPLAGVVHQPYYGSDQHGRTMWAIRGCGLHGITPANYAENGQRVIVTTRSHTTDRVEKTLKALKMNNLIDHIERVGGAGFKVLRVIEGAAAYVFASPGCKKWDTAAPQILLEEAGGKLTDVSGRKLNYRANGQVRNSGGILASAKWVDHQKLVDSIPIEVKDSLPEFDINLSKQ